MSPKQQLHELLPRASSQGHQPIPIPCLNQCFEYPLFQLIGRCRHEVPQSTVLALNHQVVFDPGEFDPILDRPTDFGTDHLTRLR